MSVPTVEAYWVSALAVTKRCLWDTLPMEDLSQSLRLKESILEFVLLLLIVWALLFWHQGFIVMIHERRILFEYYRGSRSSCCWLISRLGFGHNWFLGGYFPYTDLTWNKVAYTDLTVLALVQVWLVRNGFTDKGWLNIQIMVFLSLIT